MFIGFGHCLNAFLGQHDRCKERDPRDCISGVFKVKSIKKNQDYFGALWIQHHDVSHFVGYKFLRLEAEISVFKPGI